METLLQSVGIRGLHPARKFFINDLPNVHDELLPSVAPTGEAVEFYNRIAAASRLSFQNELIHFLSDTGKYADLLVSLPGFSARGSTRLMLAAGASVTTTFNLPDNLPKENLLILRTVGFMASGPHNLTARVFLTSSVAPDLIREVALISDQGASLSAKAVMVVVPTADNANITAVDSTQFDRLTVTLRANANTLLMPLRLRDSALTPSYTHAPDRVFVTLAGDIRFDVSAFADNNSDRLAYAFAGRVAVRLLTEKLSSNRLTLFTNTNREDTKDQIDALNREIKAHLKTAAASLVHAMQSNSTPPVEFQGTGYELGSFV